MNYREKYLPDFPHTLSSTAFRDFVELEFMVVRRKWESTLCTYKGEWTKIHYGYVLTILQRFKWKRHPFYKVVIKDDFTDKNIDDLFEALRANTETGNATILIKLNVSFQQIALLYRIVNAMASEGPSFLGEAFMEGDDEDAHFSSAVVLQMEMLKIGIADKFLKAVTIRKGK